MVIKVIDPMFTGGIMDHDPTQDPPLDKPKPKTKPKKLEGVKLDWTATALEEANVAPLSLEGGGVPYLPAKLGGGELSPSFETEYLVGEQSIVLHMEIPAQEFHHKLTMKTVQNNFKGDIKAATESVVTSIMHVMMEDMEKKILAYLEAAFTKAD